VATTDSSVEQKRRVREYWEAEPCGSEHATAPEGSPEFYAEVERKRYELEPYIARYADFEGARGLRVLEIGVGLGTDFVNFARAGAKVTGVDLTEHAVELVRRRLDLEGLEGQVLRADAESLPFQDGSFDRIYSWGVLHHTPDTARSVAEALRVLAPGGDVVVMLYGRHSWVALGFWVRHALLRGRPWTSLSGVLAEHMESDGTKAYTERELRQLFAGLDDLRVESVATSYDRAISRGLQRLSGDRLGWFLVVRGRKPSG
jgi:ubiquinone/menaquinone biosynthesis C-methylase UbiE